MPFHSCTFWRTSYACMDGKFDLKRWIMYFHIIQKWNQHTAASPQFTKPCCIYIHVIILLLSNYVYICIFHEKKRKIIKIARHQKCAIRQNILTYLFDSIYKRNPWSHLFIYILRFPNDSKVDLCITIYLLGIREFKHFKWIIMYIFKARQMVMKSTCAFKTRCFSLINVIPFNLV